MWDDTLRVTTAAAAAAATEAAAAEHIAEYFFSKGRTETKLTNF